MSTWSLIKFTSLSPACQCHTAIARCGLPLVQPNEHRQTTPARVSPTPIVSRADTA